MAYVYQYSNKGGRSLKLETLGSFRQVNLSPEFNRDGERQFDWENSISSVHMDPGYELRFWTGDNYSGENWNFTSEGNGNAKNYNLPNSGGNNENSSYTLKKMCGNIINKWDPVCNEGSPDQEKYIGNCNFNSDCYNNQRNECSAGNIINNANCVNFCTKNPSACINSINTTCNILDVTTINNTPLCNSVKDNIINKKCGESANFGNELCKTYCTNHPDNCTSAAQQYCANNMNNAECYKFCRANILKCKEPIKQHCVGNKILGGGGVSDTAFCKDVLTDTKMFSQHKDEMNRFCNDKSNNGRFNEICACLNQENFDIFFKDITDVNAKKTILGNEKCFFPNCVSGKLKTYRNVTDESCPTLKLCLININNIEFEKDAKGNLINIVNDCGDQKPPDASDGTSSSAGAGASGGAGAGTNINGLIGAKIVNANEKNFINDLYNYINDNKIIAGTVTLFITIICCCCCLLMLYMII